MGWHAPALFEVADGGEAEMCGLGEVLLAPIEERAAGAALGLCDHDVGIAWSTLFVECRLFQLTGTPIGREPSVTDDFRRWRTMMTLVLEFKHNLIFYKPGILRYAMRQARPRFSELQTRAQRRQLLSQSLKRGWAEARAELAALQRLQALTPSGAAMLLRDHVSSGAAITSPSTAPATALARQQLH